MRLAFIITKPLNWDSLAMHGQYADLPIDWFSFRLQPPSENVPEAENSTGGVSFLPSGLLGSGIC
jgi:hypothetical protein